MGYSESERIKQIKRIQKIALFLEKQEQIVLVSALYCNSELMKWNRENFNDYYEIYLDAPLSLLVERDPKKLYKKFQEGKEKNVVGMDITWHKPKDPDLEIKIKKSTQINFVLKKILNLIDF